MATTTITRSKPASRPLRAHCARPSAARAASCRAPKVCCRDCAMEVVLIDSGGANIGSVCYALERLGVAARLSADAEDIARADRVILPGVAVAGAGMARLRELGLVETVRALRQPLLGICLGMQLLFESSEENETECLGLLPGRVRKLAAGEGVRIPHMGWNSLRQQREDRL